MEGLTYTQAANHLTATVSKLPEFHSTRRVAGAHIHGGSADTGPHNKYNNSAGKGAPKSSICTVDGKIFTGFYKHWRTLTDDEKQHIIKERSRSNGATVWTNSQDGAPILLVFNKALWMGDRLHHTLINPNQLRSYGVDVQDNPFAKEDLAIITDDYIIPLATQDTTIFCDMRSPTEVELQQLPRVVLTSAIDWDPQKVQFPSHNSDRVVSNTFVQTTSDFCLHKTTYDPEHFPSRIIQQIQVDWPEGEQNPTI